MVFSERVLSKHRILSAEQPKGWRDSVYLLVKRLPLYEFSDKVACRPPKLYYRQFEYSLEFIEERKMWIAPLFIWDHVGSCYKNYLNG